ncbi:MAG TPA: hypothetical protein DHV63_09645 [Pseudomonas sp.]|nr:hypothetical protein [Pseudomonas sp.]
MAAIDYLRDRGFAARLNGKRIRVSPASKLTEDVRRYIRAHRLELIAELASNDGIERRCHWTVEVPGHKPFRMISEPVTHAEALAGARLIWPNAEVEL